MFQQKTSQPQLKMCENGQHFGKALSCQISRKYGWLPHQQCIYQILAHLHEFSDLVKVAAKLTGIVPR